MMAVESLFLTSSSLLILLLQLLLFQTSLAKPHCTPSACGIFSNISFPLRLKGDPKHCGAFELACENNVTSFYLNSHKFYVKDINLHIFASDMRLVDASVNNDICSFPTSSAIHKYYDFRYFYYELSWPIYFMSCPHPLKNSSGFTENTPCQTPTSRFTYIKVGHMNASEVPETCRVDVVKRTSWRGFNDFKNALLGEEINSSFWYEFNDFKNASLEEINSALLYGFEITLYLRSEISKWETCRVDMVAMTSWRGFKDFNDSDPWYEFNDFKNTSLEEINSALLYGFELYFFHSREATKWGKFNDQYRDKVKLPLLILLAIAVVFGAAISPVMAILGFIIVLGFLLSFFSYQFKSRILWWDTFDPLNIYTGEGSKFGVFDTQSSGFRQRKRFAGARRRRCYTQNSTFTLFIVLVPRKSLHCRSRVITA